MHPALLISEIVVKVFDQYMLPGDRQTAAALARTCKAFYEQATDIVWRELRGVTVFSRMIFPVERFEPFSIQGTMEDRFKSRTERIQAFITERQRLVSLGVEEWRQARVFTHARRVQKLSMGTTEAEDPDTYTFFAFSDAYSPSGIYPNAPSSRNSIFPSLRHLECTITSLHGLNHAVNLLKLVPCDLDTGRDSSSSGDVWEGTGSKLKSLQIAAFVPWTHHTPVQTVIDNRFTELCRISETLTGLEKLEFRCDHLSPDMEISLATALGNFRNLRYVSIGFHKHAIGRAVISVSRHPKVTEMHLTFTKGLGAPDPHPQGPFELLLKPDTPSTAAAYEYLDYGNTFKALQTLQITCDIKSIVDYLTFFDVPPSLLHLQLHITLPTDEDLVKVTRIVSSTASHLRTFGISDDRLWVSHFPTIHRIGFMNGLSPLLALGDLEEVIVNLDCVLDLNDADLTMMASAWPKLRLLYVAPWKEEGASQPSNGKAAWPTLQGVKALAERCPGLEELKLKVDASAPVTIAPVQHTLGDSGHGMTMPDKAISTSSLKRWWIGTSNITQVDVERVSDQIHQLFPDLKALHLPSIGKGEANECLVQWDRVNVIIQNRRDGI
ncbi:hypothetical protein FRB95_011997 [Tulasnella sp. JGI-2019a]|nr:hypothetical protein FRB93_007217 [Tulasnella sp. JGI-2019a]KAG9035130.1 hypothetical protein FRB95_011997 [Tulasnella sp. JGI-2019a]